MDLVLNVILDGLEFIYGRPWLALAALLIMFIWAGLLIVWAFQRTRPYLAAADARIGALKGALGSSTDAASERQAFGENYDAAASALDQEQRGSEALVQAWREFHETIIDETATPIRNTMRPTTFFSKAAPRQTGLVFASNVFVAAGLILTFLGLVAALHTAAKHMGTGGNPQDALNSLLNIASAKFLTSIGGVGASLMLRFAEHRLTHLVGARTDAICGLLERGLLYISPQRLAADQLEVLREQRDQLKFFNTDVALQLSERIGVQFQNAIAPVTTSLAELNDNMTSMSQGLGQGAAKAIEEASGGELRALGQTLSTLSERLDSLSASVGSSGEDAARQIRAAGADFAQAASDIREAFDRLTGNVDGLGGRLAEQSEAAARAQTDTLERVLGGLEEAQSKSAQAMADAVKALQEAGAQAAETMQTEVSTALATGVAESQRTFRSALDESGEALRSTAGGLVKAVGDAADQIERAGAGFVRSGEAAARTAEAMAGVSQSAGTVAASLQRSAEGFATAAAPVANAARDVGQAADRVSRAVEAGREMDAEALRSLKALSDEIQETQEAASNAWREYRARFEGVDKSLESAMAKFGDTLGGSLGEFRKFAQEFDAEMAKAVQALGSGLTQIEEYAGSLDEYVEATRKSSKEGAR